MTDQDPDNNPEAGPSEPPKPSPPPSIFALFPPIYVPRRESPPPPAPPPYTDQGCFSFCVQSSTRRSKEQDPLCRMLCLKVNPTENLSSRSAGKQPADRRWAMRRWIDEREVVYFKGALSDMRKIQAGDEPEEMKKRPKKLRKAGEWVIDHQKLKEAGLLVHIPLPIIVLSPFTTFKDRIAFLTSPFTRLVTAYASSFQDGTQTKIAGLVWERAFSGEVLEFSQKFGKRVWGVWWKKRDVSDDSDERGRGGRGGGGVGDGGERHGGH